MNETSLLEKLRAKVKPSNDPEHHGHLTVVRSSKMRPTALMPQHT